MSGPSELKSRSPLRKLMGVRILGTGSFVPDNVVTNEDLESLGCDAEWIVKRTGIRERRHAPMGMSTGDMAIAAAELALKKSGVDHEEIDMLLLATLSPDRLMPATATYVQDKLGLNCGAMDLSAACSGFLYSLITGMQYIATGCCRKVLVIGSDANSRVINPKDKKTYPLFGDGAGAVVLAPGSEEQGAMSYTLGADGSGTELLWRDAGGSFNPFDPEKMDEGSWFVSMDGRAVFKWAVRMVEQCSREVVSAAGLEIEEVDWWLLHQANARILDSVVDSLGIDRDKVVMHLDRYGNTSAGTVPLALDELTQAGKVKPGQTLIMSGFGAGLTWGSTVWRW